jgi:hypothetical protein
VRDCAWAPGHGTFRMLRAAAYSPTYNQATGTTEPYRGTDHTVAVMIQLAKGLVDPRAMVQGALQGERSIKFRRHTEQIINNLRPKDYTSEIIAISRWWGNAGRYTRDPLHVELIRSPDRLLNDALAGRAALDCDDLALAIATSCLTIGARAQFVTVGFRPRLPGQPKIHTHVFARAQDPKSKVWWVLDPVAGRKTGSMLQRVKQYTIFEVE